ncbi:MAG: hypothetical protein IJ190_04035 [Prevotella sp.]|nr:hypothetical protein [Prevotella sp.]
MKKYLLTLVAAFIAVIAFAQTGLTRQLGPVDNLRVGAVEKKLTPRSAVANIPAPTRTKILGKKAPRRAAIASIDELQGDFVIANQEYDVDEDNRLVPADVAYSGNAVTIEVTGENTIAIYGFSVDATETDAPITATVDIEKSTITIPVGQTLFTSEDYGAITLANVTSEGDITGTIYEGGVIALNDVWIDELVFQGTNYTWSNYYHYSTIAPANGIMEYQAMLTNPANGGEYQPQALNVLIIQDEDTPENVTVYNFGHWGLGVDITISSDNTFEISSDQAVDYGGSSTGYYYPVGSTAAGSLSLDIPGTVTSTTLKSDDYWTLYSYAGYWRFAQSPFTITLTDGSSFIVPETEKGELVTPPSSLVTKDYPFAATLYQGGTPSDYTATVKVGWDGTDVYVQGLDKDLTSAWIKGSYDASKGVITFPVTYTGEFNSAAHFFAAYGGEDGPDELVVDYDADADTYDYSATVMIYKGSESTSYNYFYNGFFIGTKPTPTTAPEGLVTTDMPFKGNKFVRNAEEPTEATGTAKVGRDGNDVYIQGLFSEVPEGWIKGTATTIEGEEYIVFPVNQYVGNLSNGLSAYLTGYAPSETGEDTGSAGNVIFAYNAESNYYEAVNAVILTRFKNSLNPEAFFQSGLVIGEKPASGLNNIKASKTEDGVMYNMAGQRVGSDYKGLVIKNGKKYVNK